MALTPGNIEWPEITQSQSMFYICRIEENFISQQSVGGAVIGREQSFAGKHCYSFSW